MDDLAGLQRDPGAGHRRKWMPAPAAFARMIRFALVGLASTLIYAVVAFGLAYGFHLPAAFASLLAFFTSGLFSYFGHRLFTFQTGGSHAGPATRFAGVNLLAYAVAAALPWLVSDWLGYPPAVSFVLVCILIPAMNYTLLNVFVFRDRDSAGKRLDHPRS